MGAEFDEDFTDARRYLIGTHAGIVRIRVRPTSTPNAIAALELVLAGVPDERLPGSLIIVDNQRVRVRRLS